MNGATGYIVERLDDGGTYPTSSMTLSSSTATYADSSLSEMTPYKYKVIAVGGAGNSADSAIASVVTLPTAPSALHTTSITASEVDLAWTDNSNGVAAFDVQRNNGGGWNTIGSTATGVASYQDTVNLAAGSTYHYRVIADNGTVVSVPTSSLAVLTLAAAPTNVVATPISTTEVDLAWDTMTSATTYDITYSTNGGAYGSLTTGVGANSYAFTAASAGTSYTFQIVANNATGASAPGTSNTTKTIPVAPGSFAATGVSASEVDLSDGRHRRDGIRSRPPECG